MRFRYYGEDHPRTATDRFRECEDEVDTSYLISRGLHEESAYDGLDFTNLETSFSELDLDKILIRAHQAQQCQMIARSNQVRDRKGFMRAMKEKRKADEKAARESISLAHAKALQLQQDATRARVRCQMDELLAQSKLARFNVMSKPTDSKAISDAAFQVAMEILTLAMRTG